MGYFGATNRDGYLLKGIRIFIAYWICGWALAIQQLLALFLAFRALMPPYGLAKRTLDLNKGVITLDGERTMHLLDLPIGGWPVFWGTAMGMIILGFGTYITSKRSLWPFYLHAFSFRAFLPWLGVALILSVILNTMEHFFPELRSPEMERLIKSGLSTLLPTVFAIGLLAPLFEELVFRGLLFSRLEFEFNSEVALVVTSILFALIHLQYNIYIMLCIVPFAIVLGLARIRTKSIWPSVIIHSLNNLAATMIVAAQS